MANAISHRILQQFIILKNEILNTIFPEVVCANYVKAKAFLKYFEKTYT